jgi:hypothetical protein
MGAWDHPGIVGGAPALPNCAHAGVIASRSVSGAANFISVGQWLVGQAEIDTAIVVLFGSGLDVYLLKRHFFMMAIGHVDEGVAHDGVILYFKLTTVFEYQNCRRLITRGLGQRRWLG